MEKENQKSIYEEIEEEIREEILENVSDLDFDNEDFADIG